MRVSHRIRARAFGALLLASTSGAALAATQGPSQETPPSPAALDEIVVTAQKRTERLQDVPLAISAVSGEELQAASVDTVYELPRLAPSLYVDTGFSSAKIRLAIRGIGSAGGTSVEPSVATFLDGIYLPREGMTNGAYLDLEAVEVLRGPQGTLFGRNASVGAISLRSTRPQDDFSGRVGLEYGAGPRIKGEGFINIPLGERTALRVAGQRESADVLYDNRQKGDEAGHIDSYAGRISLRHDFTDDLTTTVRASASKRDGKGYISPFALLPSSFPPGSLPTFLARNAAIGNTSVDLNPFDRNIDQYAEDRLDDRNWALSQDTSWTFGEDYTLRLLAGYNRWESTNEGTNAFPATLPTITQYTGWDSEASSVELQLISPEDKLLDGRLSFVFGLFYMQEDLEIFENLHLHPAFCSFIGLYVSAPLAGSCNAQAAVPGARVYNQGFSQNTESIAVYGQATYKFTPQFDLTLGARYTEDEKTPSVWQIVNYPVGAIFAAAETASGKIKDSRPTWRTNLSYRPTEDLMVYGSYSTGFKSAGFNSTTSAVLLGNRRFFQAETVENYEAGVRSSWMDRALTVNATVYRMDIDNFQDRSHNGISFSVQNAGAVRNQGAEIEVTAKPIDGLSMHLSVSYLDSKFTSYPGASQLPGITGGPRNLTGARPTFTPEWQGSAGAEYEHSVGSDLMLTWRGDVSFISENNIGAVNDANPDAVHPGYALLSLRATLAPRSEDWSLSVFGENLSDKNYCTAYSYALLAGLTGILSPGHSGLGCNTIGRPRTFGVAASKRF